MRKSFVCRFSSRQLHQSLTLFALAFSREMTLLRMVSLSIPEDGEPGFRSPLAEPYGALATLKFAERE